jgi:uncharacterized protein (TIGR02118 family)
MTVTIVFCLRRVESLSRQEFLEYGAGQHAPLVRESAEALQIRRYEQSHPVDSRAGEVLASVRRAPEPFDGVATLWFDSVEDMQAAGATPEGRAAGRRLLEDERRFIDLARSPIWLAEPRQEI